MVEEIVKFTSHPCGKDIDNMCRSLIEKYPYLKDLGPGGYSTWCTFVKFRIGNVRKTLKNHVDEIAKNSGRRSNANPNAPSPHSSIKKQRTGTVLVPRSLMKDDDLSSNKMILNSELAKPQPNFRQVRWSYLDLHFVNAEQILLVLVSQVQNNWFCGPVMQRPINHWVHVYCTEDPTWNFLQAISVNYQMF